MFNQFICAGKRARMKLTRLQVKVKHGGLRLPNLSLYQGAFVGARIVSLLSNRVSAPLWVDLEEELNAPLRAADYLSHCPNADVQNPIISHTRNIWHHIHKTEGISPFLTESASVWNNPKLKIGGNIFFWR